MAFSYQWCWQRQTVQALSALIAAEVSVTCSEREIPSSAQSLSQISQKSSREWLGDIVTQTQVRNEMQFNSVAVEGPLPKNQFLSWLGSLMEERL